MDSEKDKLVTGSHNGEVIAWNFEVNIIYLFISKLFDHLKISDKRQNSSLSIKNENKSYKDSMANCDHLYEKL